MADDKFDEQFAEAFSDDAPVVEEPKQQPTEEPKQDEPKDDPKTDPKTDDTPTEEAPKSEEEAPKPPETPAEETPTEAPKPLTVEDVRSVISELRNEERSSGKELETTTQEVIEAYYPEGLSNVLVDEKSGKELRTPQDVIDASGGAMSMDEASQWLMNEQFKLNQQVDEIKNSAKQIAEQTLKFKQDGEIVIERYTPLFKAYPQIQEKVWNQYIKLVQADKEKGVILSAPDMQEFYDTMLEPYVMAYEHAKQQSATQPTQAPTPEPPKPTADDRLDESGDASGGDIDDPNDFAQQVAKELKTGV